MLWKCRKCCHWNQKKQKWHRLITKNIQVFWRCVTYMCSYPDYIVKKVNCFSLSVCVLIIHIKTMCVCILQAWRYKNIYIVCFTKYVQLFSPYCNKEFSRPDKSMYAKKTYEYSLHMIVSGRRWIALIVTTVPIELTKMKVTHQSPKRLVSQISHNKVNLFLRLKYLSFML